MNMQSERFAGDQEHSVSFFSVFSIELPGTATAARALAGRSFPSEERLISL